jgi:hypothetical protein
MLFSKTHKIQEENTMPIQNLDLQDVFQTVCEDINDFTKEFVASIEHLDHSKATLVLHAQDYNPSFLGMKPLPIRAYISFIYSPSSPRKMKDTMHEPQTVFIITKMTYIDSKKRVIDSPTVSQIYAQEILDTSDLSDVGHLITSMAAEIYHDCIKHIKAHQHDKYQPVKTVDILFLTKFYNLVAHEVTNNTHRLFAKATKVENNQAILILRDMDADDEPNYDTTPFTITLTHAYDSGVLSLILIPQISFANNDGYKFTKTHLSFNLSHEEAKRKDAILKVATMIAHFIADNIYSLK